MGPEEASHENKEGEAELRTVDTAAGLRLEKRIVDSSSIRFVHFPPSLAPTKKLSEHVCLLTLSLSFDLVLCRFIEEPSSQRRELATKTKITTQARNTERSEERRKRKRKRKKVKCKGLGTKIVWVVELFLGVGQRFTTI